MFWSTCHILFQKQLNLHFDGRFVVEISRTHSSSNRCIFTMAFVRATMQTHHMLWTFAEVFFLVKTRALFLHRGINLPDMTTTTINPRTGCVPPPFSLNALRFHWQLAQHGRKLASMPRHTQCTFGGSGCLSVCNNNATSYGRSAD